MTGVTTTREPIQIEGLDFAFGSRQIFDGFNFAADRRIVLLRGPSGCGKTSLLKLLFGLIDPQRCKIMVRPQPSFLVLQQDALVPWFTGEENVARFSRQLWLNVQANRMFGMIAPFVSQRAAEMSFGQRRAIELVRALSAKPSLLLLDEPFNFLDAPKRQAFIEEINSLGEGNGTTIVLTSHYAEDVPLRNAQTFDFVGDLPHRSLHAIA